MLSDVLVPGKSSVRSIRSLWQMKEDWALFFRGKLNLWSMLNGYVPFNDTVELRVFDKGGRVKAVRYSHNIRTTQGRDQWQRLAMFGNITSNATGFTSVTGTASSAPTSTSLTNSSASFPTTGGPNVSLQGQIVVCPVAGVYGVIMSNTSTLLTVDQWYNMTSSSAAAGTTPANGAAYAILPNAGIALWIGLSTNSTTAAAGDVLRSADGLFGDGTSSGAATEQTTSGLARAFVQPTFPSAGAIQLQHTWTYTGSSTVTLQKAVLCNSLAAAGSLLFCESNFSAPASPSASGDTAQLTWTINL